MTMACRRHVPMAPSLCVTPMPPRITRKSTRPRASDRPMVDTVQPQALAQFQKPIGVVATNGDAAAEMEQTQNQSRARHQTSVFHSERGWMSRKSPRLQVEGEV